MIKSSNFGEKSDFLDFRTLFVLSFGEPGNFEMSIQSIEIVFMRNPNLSFLLISSPQKIFIPPME